MGLGADLGAGHLESSNDFRAIETEKIGIGAEKPADIGVVRQIGQPSRLDRFDINQTDPQVAGDRFKIMAQIFAHFAHHRAQLGSVETFSFRGLHRIHIRCAPHAPGIRFRQNPSSSCPNILNTHH